MKVLRVLVPLLVVILIALAARAQSTGVTAEAIGQANVRSEPSTNGELIGEIFAGTRYPVIGRSQFVPWLLLANPTTNQPLGWIFQDLLNVQGDVNTLPFTEQAVNPNAQPPIVPTATLSVQTQPAVPGAGAGADPNATPEFVIVNGIPIPASEATAFYSPPTATPIVSLATGRVLGEINIRYGPGVEYDRVGVARAGEVFPIVARHTQVTWVQIAYPPSPNGLAWVAQDLLEIEGDLNALPAISQLTFNLPTLTPTPSAIERAGISEVPVSPEFSALGSVIYERMLERNFDPETSRLGAFFLMNLATGEAIAIGDDTTFSGMSINKIAILATLFGQIDTLPNDETATTIAEAMICSENISTNEMLAIIGDGNPFVGAQRVSEFLAQLGLERTFIYTPYANDPFITPQAPLMPAERFNAGAGSLAEPDPYNQMSVIEVGSLLNAIYQCAYNETGAMLTNFENLFTSTECRQILDVMSYNRIGNFIESGVPADVSVAHKHGWIEDTHGDAALVRSPGGDYIFVVALHNPEWLEFVDSEFVIEESSRDIYNYFNPDTPLSEVRPPDVTGECNLLGSPALEVLLNPPY